MALTTHKQLLRRLAKLERERHSRYQAQAQSSADKAAYLNALSILQEYGLDEESLFGNELNLGASIPRMPITTPEQADVVLQEFGIELD